MRSPHLFRRLLPRALVVVAAASTQPACGRKPVERNVQYKIQHNESPDTREGALDGKLADSEIRRVMEEQQAGFVNCFRENPDPFISGRLELTFVVKATGRVEQVFVSKSDVGAVTSEDCIVQTGKFLEFPPPRGGKARFAYPLEWNAPGERLSEGRDLAWGYATLTTNRERFERCRAKHKFDTPFHLTVYVGRSGGVLNAGYSSDVGPDADFPSCVVDIVKTLRFPNPGSRIIKYQALVEHLPDELTPMNKDID